MFQKPIPSYVFIIKIHLAQITQVQLFLLNLYSATQVRAFRVLISFCFGAASRDPKKCISFLDAKHLYEALMSYCMSVCLYVCMSGSIF